MPWYSMTLELPSPPEPSSDEVMIDQPDAPDLEIGPEFAAKSTGVLVSMGPLEESSPNYME